jgi:CheY-like chemotaxis protein
MEQNPYFLYVEDDDEDVMLLQDMLKIFGQKMNMVPVPNGFKAITYLQQVEEGSTYPEFILLDINMPILDGLETLELLRSDDMYCLIPVLLFTTSNNEEQATKCKQLGSEILLKPDNYQNWFELMKKLTIYSAEA